MPLPGLFSVAVGICSIHLRVILTVLSASGYPLVCEEAGLLERAGATARCRPETMVITQSWGMVSSLALIVWAADLSAGPACQRRLFSKRRLAALGDCSDKRGMLFSLLWSRTSSLVLFLWGVSTWHLSHPALLLVLF